MKEGDIKRFWDKVDARGPGDCWEWKASINSSGYGQFSIGYTNNISSRVSWVINNGPIPDGICVLHSCDNRKCVNPAHLFLGTNHDNVIDMRLKGRARPVTGELNSNAVLSDLNVLVIRAMRTDGLLCREIASLFGVSRQTVQEVVAGRRWSHVY